MASVDEFPVHYNSAVSGHELLSDLKAEQVEMEQTKADSLALLAKASAANTAASAARSAEAASINPIKLNIAIQPVAALHTDAPLDAQWVQRKLSEFDVLTSDMPAEQAQTEVQLMLQSRQMASSALGGEVAVANARHSALTSTVDLLRDINYRFEGLKSLQGLSSAKSSSQRAKFFDLSSLTTQQRIASAREHSRRMPGTHSSQGSWWRSQIGLLEEDPELQYPNQLSTTTDLENSGMSFEVHETHRDLASPAHAPIHSHFGDLLEV